jgi:hypothetical protein
MAACALSADRTRLVAADELNQVDYTSTNFVSVLSLLAPDNVVSWVIPSPDFTLQQRPDLSNWLDMTNVPVLNFINLENQTALPTSLRTVSAGSNTETDRRTSTVESQERRSGVSR